jgi:hypothetical protein
LDSNVTHTIQNRVLPFILKNENVLHNWNALHYSGMKNRAKLILPNGDKLF